MSNTKDYSNKPNIWEDTEVIAYQCKAKGGIFMQPIRLGLGATEGLTLGEINAELGESNGKYVAFPIDRGGMVVRKRRAKTADAKIAS